MTVPNLVINVAYDDGGVVTVKDDITTPNLRYSDDGYATAVYSGVNQTSGRYSFTNVESGVYRFYDGASAVAGLSDVHVGESGVVTLTTTQIISGTKTFTGVTTLEKPLLGGGGVAIDISEDVSVETGSKLEVADAPATLTSVARKTETDALQAQITANETYFFDKRAGASTQGVFPLTTFTNYVTLYKDPTALLHAANRKFVENYVTAVLNGFNPSAFQQSGNIIRVLYSGVQETNKVYTTLTSGLAAAAAYATSTRIMTIDVQGSGVDMATTGYDDLPVAIDDYCHFHSSVVDNRIVVAEDSYAATSVGTNIISGFIIDNENDAANTSFDNFIFINCKFTNLVGTGSPRYDFTGCQFWGDCRFENCAVTTDSNCVGSLYDIDNGYMINLQAQYRELGRVSTLASAATLTLTAGNYYHITGSTSISRITSTGWTPGSRIFLYFAALPTITAGTAASGDDLGIITLDGNDIVHNSAGDYLELILNSDGTFWLEGFKKLQP